MHGFSGAELMLIMLANTMAERRYFVVVGDNGVFCLLIYPKLWHNKAVTT